MLIILAWVVFWAFALLRFRIIVIVIVIDGDRDIGMKKQPFSKENMFDLLYNYY